MKKVVLGGAEYVIREFTIDDSCDTNRFLAFIDALASDPRAMIKLKETPSPNEEERWLEAVYSSVSNRHEVMVLAENGDDLVGIADMKLHPGRSDHVAEIAISVMGERNRGIGLGSALMTELLDAGLAGLKPTPAFLRLSVFEKNERAIALYEKLGFTEVARVPDQFEFHGELQDELILLRRLA